MKTQRTFVKMTPVRHLSRTRHTAGRAAHHRPAIKVRSGGLRRRIPLFRHAVVTGLLILSFGAGSTAEALTVLPLGLEQLHGRASHIFVGRCIDNSVQHDTATGLTATYTTFEVLERLRGAAGGTYTLKQVGGSPPGDPGGLVIHGVPHFETGQRYLVFLPTPSRSGFSSPVGLSQGTFQIRHDGGTVDVTGNGRPIAQLVANVPSGRMPKRVQDRLVALTRPAERPAQNAWMPLDDLLDIIRGLEQTR